MTLKNANTAERDMSQELPNPNKILDDLVKVLGNCSISSWQTVHWRDELDVAIEYLDKIKGRCDDTTND